MALHLLRRTDPVTEARQAASLAGLSATTATFDVYDILRTAADLPDGAVVRTATGELRVTRDYGVALLVA